VTTVGNTSEKLEYFLAILFLSQNII